MSTAVRICLAAFAAAWLVGVAIAGVDHHHGIDSGRTPLPIQRATGFGYGNAYRLTVECADDIQVVVGKDHGGSALPEVTVWGRPRIGRCHPDAVVSFPETAFQSTPHNPPLTKIVDGATSDVVHLT